MGGTCISNRGNKSHFTECRIAGVYWLSSKKKIEHKEPEPDPDVKGFEFKFE